MAKRGDTLIEVTLAIGIFSMVAISVVAVMTGGISNTQNALETTLAREEIDTQAEALRFIHSAYLADEETGRNKDVYTQLWETITNNAYVPGKSESIDTMIQQYNPASCQDIFDHTKQDNPSNLGNEIGKYAFVIDTHALGSLSPETINNVYVRYSRDLVSNKFQETHTYPRLVYNEKNIDATDALLEDNRSSNNNDRVYKVEGIYVLAVKDPKSTSVVSADSGLTSAYYDFYIRTCWYGSGSDTPSTISTVIRLYDPKGIEHKLQN